MEMGHELRPRSGELPTVAEVERRLRAAFAYVYVDLDEGVAQVRRSAEWIDARPASFYESNYPGIAAQRARLPERAKALRALPHGSAAGFTIGDTAAGPILHFFFVIPGDPIMFGYRGGDDERQLRPLVNRCAEALDADVVLF
jgi:hypothetical protein